MRKNKVLKRSYSFGKYESEMVEHSTMGKQRRRYLQSQRCIPSGSGSNRCREEKGVSVHLETQDMAKNIILFMVGINVKSPNLG
jgi:hypothetical protein